MVSLLRLCGDTEITWTGVFAIGERMSVPLETLQPGQTATVEGFTLFDEMSQRLMHMGLVEGAELEVIRRAPSGDPIEIEVLGYALSLRRSEAAHVLVDPTE